MIIAHLRALLPSSHPDTKLYSFKAIHAAAFQAYLREQGTYFAMFHDGAVSNSLASLDMNSDNVGVTNAQYDDEEISRRTTLRAAIFSFIAHGYNIALLNGLEWLDTKVHISATLRKVADPYCR